MTQMNADKKEGAGADLSSLRERKSDPQMTQMNADKNEGAGTDLSSLRPSAQSADEFLRAALEAVAAHVPTGATVTFRQRTYPLLAAADEQVLPRLRELGVRYFCGRSEISDDLWLTIVADERIGPARQRLALAAEDKTS